MSNLPYQIIYGNRRDARLLWSPKEQMLYYRKRVLRSGNEDWVCYQEILRRNKTKDVVACSCALSVNPNRATCSRKSFIYSNHDNHASIFKDIVSRNNMVEDCILLKKATEGLSIKVPVGEIFTRELAK